MAGTIAITENDRWSVASCAYHWVLDYLINHASDPETVAELTEIDENNLGWVEIHEFPAAAREELLRLIVDEVVPDAERRLLPENSDRESAIDVIRDLRALAAKHRR